MRKLMISLAALAAVAPPAWSAPSTAGWREPAASLRLSVGNRTPRNPGGPAAAAPTAGAAPGTPAEVSATDLNGGHQDTLADCMAIWDKATHMTKAEWRATCLRNMQTHRGI